VPLFAFGVLGILVHFAMAKASISAAFVEGAAIQSEPDFSDERNAVDYREPIANIPLGGI